VNALVKNLLLLVVFLAVAGGLYYNEVHLAERRTAEEQRQKRVFDVTSADVRTLSLSVLDPDGAGRSVVELQRSRDDTWQMTTPVADRADDLEVNRLVNELADLARESVVVDEPKDPAEFGLANPLSKVTFTVAGGGAYGLDMGIRNPVGYTTYVRRSDERRICLVNASLESYLTKRAVDLRRRKLFDVRERTDVRDITLSFQEGDRLRLIQAGTTWRVEEPFSVPLDQGAVDRMVDAFRDLRVDWFITEEPEDIVPFGLNVPTLTVTATVGPSEPGGADRRLVLTFGGEAKGDVPGDPSKKLSGWYCRTSLRPTVYVVATYQLERIAKKLADLRDRTICPAIEPRQVTKLVVACRNAPSVDVIRTGDGWVVPGDDGFPCDKATVEGLIDALSDLRAEQFVADDVRDLQPWGLDAPSVSLTANDVTTKGERTVDARFSIKDGTTVYATTGTGSSVFRVKGELQKKLPELPVFLLTRRIADEVQRDEVLAVDVRAAALEDIRFERTAGTAADSAKRWTLVRPPDQQFMPSRADAWLGRIKALRASAYMQSGREHLAQFGLNEPVAEVTIALRGNASSGGPATTFWWLKLGAPTEDKLFYYAMSSSRDAVFTLRKADANLALLPDFVERTGSAGSTVSTSSAAGSDTYVPSDHELSTLPRAVFETDKGPFTVILFEDEAPNTVANFVSLIEKGFYDGTAFHRVENFCIQGGDPNSKNEDPSDDGKGGPGYTIADEISPKRRHTRGVLSMAHRGAGTGGSQFFVTKTRAAWLDNVHTVFGAVVDGMAVVDAIAKGDRISMVKVANKRAHPYLPKIRNE